MSARAPEENPFESIAACIAFSPEDWGQHHRMAWIYGIVFGWDDESMAEMARRHRWRPDDVQRLRRLNAGYRAQCRPKGT